VKGSDRWEGQGVDGTIILKCISRRLEGRDTGRALVAAVTKLRVNKKCGEFTDYLRNCWLFKKTRFHGGEEEKRGRRMDKYQPKCHFVHYKWR
jgi:hypothetical protein